MRSTFPHRGRYHFTQSEKNLKSVPTYYVDCRLTNAISKLQFADYEHVTADLKHLFLTATDIHPNPGPITIHVNNITSANTHKQVLGEDKADLLFVSEASLAEHELAEVKTFLRKEFNKEANFKATYIRSAHRTGGVGAIARAPHRLQDIKAMTEDFEQLNATGRVALYCVEAAGALLQYWKYYTNYLHE